MIDGRFDQHFLELFAHRQRLRRDEPKVSVPRLAAMLVVVVVTALLLV
jgi:hypothetical protein